jgi:hypothetical protein
LIGVTAEYEFIQARYGEVETDWSLEQQTAYQKNSRTYDKFKIVLSEGVTKLVYFDITNFYGKP